MLGPQGPDMCSKELLLEIQEAAFRLDTGIHMHVSQGDREINQMMKRYGKRSIPFLDEIGYLNHRLMAVHLTEATKEETQLLASKGALQLLMALFHRLQNFWRSVTDWHLVLIKPPETIAIICSMK